MARSLHSDKLSINTDNLHQRLIDDLTELKTTLRLRKLDIFKWDENNVAISLKLKVELPARGVHNDLDIKSVENILILFDRLKYPHIPPKVFSDRKSFPTEGISHLYVTKPGKPVPLCLVRGNYKEWYANKLLPDLIDQVKSWLRDAAWGMLDTDGDQYDPMRLELYQGNIIYDHEQLSNVVLNQESYDDLLNIAFVLVQENQRLDLSGGKPLFPAYQLLKIIKTPQELNETFKPIIKSLAINDSEIDQKRIVLGAIVWDNELRVNSNFPGSLPSDFNGLLNFCKQYDIDNSLLFNLLPLLKFANLEELPVLVAVNRPLSLIGYNSNIEFFNFYLRFKKDAIKDNKIVSNFRVGYQKHLQPLTISKAKEISKNSHSIGKVMQIGCGAIGSKVAMHKIREGGIDEDYILLDNDKIEPHNIVRHGLLSAHVGSNKAISLMSEANRIFQNDKKKSKIWGLPLSGNFFFDKSDLEKILKGFDWIIDFTASEAYENFLVEQKLPSNLKVAKGVITDNGNIGMLIIEGSKRNPRIDDIKVIIQSSYQEDEIVSTWLIDEYNRSKVENPLVNVGVGCNSETTILDDSSISLHSSSFYKSIKAENINSNRSKGISYLSIITSANEFSFHTKRYEVKPLTVFVDPITGWQIRIKNGLVDIMMSEMGRQSPIETGGVLIGLVNNKTHCVHVTDIVFAPSDSISDEVCFVRGVRGLKEEVNKHKELSGQTFGYIGEWHSHPMGPLRPSLTDIKTMEKTKRKYKKDNLRIPVVMIIATPKGIIPCISK